jgi:hypothetical protein
MKASLRLAISFATLFQLLSPADAYAQVVAPTAEAEEPHDSGWEFYIDNDVFFGTDNNYSGGFALTLSGQRAREHVLSVDGVRAAIDRGLGVERLYRGAPTVHRHRIEFGTASFTPHDIEKLEPILDDHPYACLLFVNNSSQVTLADEATSYQTHFLLGLLGTKACEVVQKVVHDVIKTDEPLGWDNQISRGGELTFQWGISRQRLLSRIQENDKQGELSLVTGAQVGFTTGVGIGINARWGRFGSPWWSFAPHQEDYINLGSPTATSTSSEFYFWTGGILRARFYNSILQGQFRDSIVEHEGDQLNRLIAEVWFGVTRTFSPGLTGSIVARARTHELKGLDGAGAAWLSFAVRRSF